LAGIVAWLRRRYIVITVAGVSMEPAYGHGDRVLVRRASLEAVRRGHVVVLAGRLAEMWPGLAAPTTDGAAPSGGGFPSAGESPDASEVPDAGLELTEVPVWMIKRVKAVSGDPVPRGEVSALRHVPERVVPEGCLVVLGDNAEASRDSRHFGYVPSDRLIGVVVRRMAAGDDVRTAL
jgi:signal peptidase I